MPTAHTTQPTDALLDSQLHAYGQRAGRRRRKAGAAELLGCTAAAGGLAFAGGDAMGAIVHNSTGTTLSASSSRNSFDIDLDGAGNADWQLFISGYNQIAFASHSDKGAGATVATGPSGVVNAIKLAPGFVVGPTLASGFFNSAIARWYFSSAGSAEGPFYNGTTGYLGLRFDGDTGAGGTQYAWVKVRFDRASPKITMNVLEWAYDDSGAAIAVGDTGAAVPAPATPLLTLLGLGAMGVAAYRRRREEGLKRLADEQG
jgi:hypothetical protein